jgi:hypothetical protein
VDEVAAGENGDLAAALQATKIVVISKSGTTQETRSHQQYFEDLYTAQQVDPKGHFMLVTDPGSPMEQEASQKGYDLRSIQLNGRTDIGGRFTAPATTVFLLPLALVAPDKVKVILERAKAMNEKDAAEDLFLRLGVFLYHTAKNLGMDKVTLLVPPELRDLPGWSEQLFEESLGKEGKGIALVYGENLGPEQLKTFSTSDRVFVRFNLAGEETQKDFAEYLKAHRYPLFDIPVESVDDLGGVMLGLQRTVAAIAYLWNINFVNQPGVEGYKKQTQEVLAKLKEGAKVEIPQEWQFASYKEGLNVYYTPFLEAGIATLAELQAEVNKLNADLSNAPAVYAALINIAAAKGLEQNLAGGSGGRFEVAELASYGRMTEGFRQVIEKARFEIFTDGLKMASKVAEGPDKNHSFQQNIAEGKDMFFSTYFMPLKTVQPRVLEYNENSLRAQTIGTVRSLVDGGRKVVLISLKGSIAESEAITKDFFNEVRTMVSASSPITSFVVNNVHRIVNEQNGWEVLAEMRQQLSLGAVRGKLTRQSVLPLLRMDGQGRTDHVIARKIIEAAFGDRWKIIFDDIDRDGKTISIMGLATTNRLTQTLSGMKNDLDEILSAVEAGRSGSASSPLPSTRHMDQIRQAIEDLRAGVGDFPSLVRLLSEGNILRSIKGPADLPRDTILAVPDNITGRRAWYLVNEIRGSDVYVLAGSGTVRRLNLDTLTAEARYMVVPPVDKLVSSPIAADTPKQNVGGIDLNPALLDLQIKRDGSGVPLPLPQQPLETMNIEGFLPVIINIIPMPALNLQMILGRDEPRREPAPGGDAAEDQPQDRRPKLSRLEKYDFVGERYFTEFPKVP